MTVSVRTLWPLLEYLDARGVDRAPVLAFARIEPAALSDPEARVPHEAAIAAWAEAERLALDADLGLHVAQSTRRGTFGALEYAVRSSSTIGAGFRRLFRYNGVLHNAAQVGLEIVGDAAVMHHRWPLLQGAPRHITEFVIGCWWLAIREMTRMSCAPMELRFMHAQPDDLGELGRVFGAPFKFGWWRTELIVPAHVLDLPMPEADPALQSLVEQQLAAWLASLPRGDSTGERVRRLLATHLCDGEPTLDVAASKLHMSTRTLHRRLRDENSSFREIVSAVRRELAQRYLVETDLTAGEIAFLLGYSDPSVFHRAFKRWTDVSPQSWRGAGGVFGSRRRRSIVRIAGGESRTYLTSGARCRSADL